jgi:DNA repair protein RadD
MNLRPYQLEAVDAVHTYLRTHTNRNPVVVIPTGGGKTPVIATLCRDIADTNGRVCVLAHVKELLEQTADKLRVVAPDVPVGVYSAGLRRKDSHYAVTVAGIQSIGKKACEVGAFDLLLVDEAHLIPFKDDGLYRTFIKDAMTVNPHLRVVGLTATPYRMKGGMICGESNILHEVCYEIGVSQLISEGYLSPLKSRGSKKATVDTSKLHTAMGEFVAGEVESLMDTEALVTATVDEMLTLAEGRKSVLIFCAGKDHAGHVRDRLRALGHQCGIVTDDSSPLERSSQIADFKDGRLRFMTNVNVLTTGFDAPNVDCVVLLRPTMSPGLYYQMVGRGFRLCEGKADCLVLDFAGNVWRHGPVDALQIKQPGKGGGPAPTKECPECFALCAAGCLLCPECQHEFPPPVREVHDTKASGMAILKEDHEPEIREVTEVGFYVHEKRNDPKAPTTLRVEYGLGAFGQRVSEWVCFNHIGYALEKAHKWWKARSNCPVPPSTELACELAKLGALADTLEVTLQAGENPRFPKITRAKLGPKPPVTEAMLSMIENELSGKRGERVAVAASVPAWVSAPSKPRDDGWIDPDEIPF